MLWSYLMYKKQFDYLIVKTVLQILLMELTLEWILDLLFVFLENVKIFNCFYLVKQFGLAVFCMEKFLWNT
jgi:hypothetical protein